MSDDEAGKVGQKLIPESPANASGLHVGATHVGHFDGTVRLSVHSGQELMPFFEEPSDVTGAMKKPDAG